jgi:hypothetical protein
MFAKTWSLVDVISMEEERERQFEGNQGDSFGVGLNPRGGWVFRKFQVECRVGNLVGIWGKVENVCLDGWRWKVERGNWSIKFETVSEVSSLNF